ncbi:MAG: hypothetical protein CMI09_07655 [Oceanospirillaceae bacterium]|nr:hypothetical protein [Oceanospirillaceae bacterium]
MWVLKEVGSLVGFYLNVIRSFWLGGLWGVAYVARPVLEKAGFFPVHGMEVVHWMIGLGIVAALLSLSLMWVAGTWSLTNRSFQLIVSMAFLSLIYFALHPWWKLQMMVVHAVCALGVLWLLNDSRRATTASVR